MTVAPKIAEGFAPVNTFQFPTVNAPFQRKKTRETFCGFVLECK
jgi:hypothetical protein